MNALVRNMFAKKVLMVSPTHFASNSLTAVDNHFMKQITLSPEEVNHRAQEEFKGFQNQLVEAGAQVKAYPQGDPEAPDSIFPNNWFSTHRLPGYQGGSFYIYPMKAVNRQKEVNPKIVEDLKKDYNIFRDLRPKWIPQQIALEGTGSLIFDPISKKIYAAISQRCDKQAAEEFNNDFNSNLKEEDKFKLITFPTFDKSGGVIYHTNCMMAVLSEHIAVCMDSIGKEERPLVEKELKESKQEVLVFSMDQMEQFACNILCLQGEGEKMVVVMSKRAHQSLSKQNREILEKNYRLVVPNLSIIEEVGGGSARCMIGELF